MNVGLVLENTPVVLVQSLCSYRLDGLLHARLLDALRHGLDMTLLVGVSTGFIFAVLERVRAKQRLRENSAGG